MRLFAEYLEPLTAWLNVHPNWALFIAFAFAFIESLAVIGSIIPGTVVMTAVGILAGSGIMRIDLTLIITAIGAIMGDTASYFLGYTYSDTITQMWPFRKYPVWLQYGQTYFDKHGGKSVLLGRFIGPLRSIIPVIAGMMKMKHIPFLVANVLSGIAWSIVYVTPGIVVGAASHELSTEGATRLFLLVLALLVLIWLVTVALKWLILRASHYVRNGLHIIWSWLEYHPWTTRFTQYFTPPSEGHHAGTAGLIVAMITTLIMIGLLLIWAGIIDEIGYVLDLPVYFFFQSLRTQPLDILFVIVTCFISAYSICLFWGTLSAHFIHTRNWRLMRYWTSLAVTSIFFTQVFGAWMTYLRLDDAPLYHATYTQPSTPLVTATAFFGFLLLQLGHVSLKSLARVLRLSWSILLTLGGFALLYLGDTWLTSVLMSYSLGILFALGHWLLYRRFIPNYPPTTRSLWFASGIFVAASLGVTLFHMQTSLREHYPYPEQYEVSSQAWWHQRTPLLPLYAKNRFGHPTGIFNIQYLGSIHRLQKALEAEGWRQRSSSFMRNVIQRANHFPKHETVAIKTPLYLNRKPYLVMAYEVPSDDTEKVGFIFSIWRSNYRLRNQNEPIWLGSLQPYPINKKKRLNMQHISHMISQKMASPFYVLLPALQGFEFNTLPLPPQTFQSLPDAPYPLLLIIKESP